MRHSRQNRVVLVVSIGLTALLLGVLVGGMSVSRMTGRQLRDPEFLRQRLEAVDPKGDRPGDHGQPPLVRVAAAAEKTVQPQRSIIGRLVEVRRVTASSEVTGKILEMPVAEGTPVVGGKSVLARVDDVWSRLAWDRCRAQVASTQAQLTFELSELRRYESLRDAEATTPSDLESRQAAVAELQARLEEAKTGLEEEKERRDRSVILAPFDGTVVVKHAELGDRVAPGSPIVEIVSRGAVDALLMVPESMVNFISIDQPLSIRVDPLRTECQGKVVSITPCGPSASRTFPVRVRLDDREGQLKVGMSVAAMIQTALERKALVVAKDAVLVRPDGATVWVAVGASAEQTVEVHPVPVQITVRAADEYAVEPETDRGRAVLIAGTRVVIEGGERLIPGQQVRIVALRDEHTEQVDQQRGMPVPRPDEPVQSTRHDADRQRGG